jgi:lipoprotein NlpD
MALALGLAACSSPTPAPIVPRTQPGAARPAEPARAPTPAPAPAAGAPQPTAPAPEASVQTAPIRSGTVESRGLESRPLDPNVPAPGAPGAATVPPAVTPPSAPVLPPNAKTGPRGTKVPFSDAALAELRAAESAPPPAAGAAAPAAAATAPRAPEPKPAEAPDPKAAEAAEGDWAWPAAGKVVQSFTESGNKGVVLGGRVGDPVLAAADGRVIFSGNGPRGYGNLVIVKHTNDLLSVYAHNRTLSVKEGQPVKRGQKIAELGDSGTTSPRLHFEIRQQGKPVDPARFLPKR